MLKRSDLHGYQEAGVRHIIEHPYSGLFLDMGLGKTAATLTAIDALIYDYCEVSSVLVVAPKRVAETVWEEEARKWTHLSHMSFSKIIGTPEQRIKALRTRADVYVVSRDNVMWLCAQGARYDMIVADELSSFKSHKSQRFKALRGLRTYAKRFVGLTGTPAPNGLIDLWPQIYLMDRGTRLGKTVTAYRNTYFRPAKTNGHIVYSYALREGAEHVIKERIKDICVSMTAKEYLDMPLRTDNYVMLRMPPALQKRYRDFERDKVLELSGDEISAVNAAALSNKLLQFANGAVYDECGSARKVVRIHDLKTDALKEIIDGANGQSVLVAWTYQFDRDRIKEILAEYEPRELKSAEDISDWNAGKIRLLLAHPASAGHGLNLQQGGHIIVWYGQTWSLELYQQFNARLYRQGQCEAVVIHHLVVEGTEDEEVIKALRKKDKSQNALIESVKAKMNKYILK